MSDTSHRPLEVAYHVERLRAEGELLAGAAARAGMDAPVPACPDWQVRDLLTHLGIVHRWAAANLSNGHDRPAARRSEAEMLRDGPDDAALLEWFGEGHAALVAALTSAGPGLRCWTFLAAPSPLAFWARRQAHETAIHRADAEQAEAAHAGPRVGLESQYPARFAADGIDELIMGFLGRDVERDCWELPAGTLGIYAEDSDCPAAWRVCSEAGHGTVAREPGPADCEVRGTASALYLLLWNRADTGAVRVDGDPAVLSAFRESLTITWGG